MWEMRFDKCAKVAVGTVPVSWLYEVKVGKLYEALNKNFLDINGHKCCWIEAFNG